MQNKTSVTRLINRLLPKYPSATINPLFIGCSIVDKTLTRTTHLPRGITYCEQADSIAWKYAPIQHCWLYPKLNMGYCICYKFTYDYLVLTDF